MKNSNDKQRKRPIGRRALIMLAAACLVAAGIWWIYQSRTPAEMTAEAEKAETGGRTVAYWRAPMNPTEIYDKPGKSAMGMDLVPVYEDELAGGQGENGTGRKIAYWRAPMNPTEIYDAPGKSAMGMDRVPVYEDELVGGVEIKVDPVVQQNMGIRTEVVTEAPLVRSIRTYGHVTEDETRTAQVNLKTTGWIKELYVDFTGKFVRKGDPLFTINSPELLAAQEEFLVTAKSMKGRGGGQSGDLLASARRRLAYFDVAPDEIEALEETGEIKMALLIRSPFTGVVIERNVEEGAYVKSGSTVMRIADLSQVWVEAHIFEYELGWVEEGQSAEMRLSYLPGDVYRGKVSYVYPYLQPQTRDVVIRLEFENPGMRLKPDMYADVLIHAGKDETGLVIPSEAVIRSGERNVVFVVGENNRFIPRNVTLGLEFGDGQVQVIKGLAPGEVIVVSGQFLLDSESKLKEAVRKMMDVKRTKAKKAEEMEMPGPAEQPSEDQEDFFRDLEIEEEDTFSDMQTE